MKVSQSAYLSEARPLLEELLRLLLDEYEYASLLAMDERSKVYQLSGAGAACSENALLSKRGFVAKVYHKGSYAEYSFNEISPRSLLAITARIRESLIPMGEKLPPMLRESEYEKLPDEKAKLFASTDYVLHPEELGDKAILERLTALRSKGKAMDGRILDCRAVLNYQELHKLFLSKNRDLEQNILWTNGALYLMASRGEEIKNYYESYSNLGGAELLEDMDKDVERAVKTVLELLLSEPIVPGEYDCVCMPSVTGMIVHEAFGHGVEMDMFVKDRALAKSYMGKPVASSLVTMHDGAEVMKESGSYFFDDEGVLARDTVIIDRGVLVSGISDAQSAMHLKTVPTGNGRRESFERKAYTRMTNTYFEGGTDSLEDMIASVKYGFLLDNPTSGMEDPKNWGIQCMVNFAREIKDGKLTGKLFSPIVLTGYVPDLLQSISMMSPNVTLSGGGMCGKGYKEWVKVSDGGPCIKARIRLG